MKKIALLGLGVALALSLAACGQTPSPQPSATAAPSPAIQSAAPGGFAPVTAVDNSLCLLQVVGIDPGAKAGYTVKTQLVNRSKAAVLFSLDYAAVDGVQTAAPFSVEVPAGESAAADLVLETEVLEYYGVTGFTDIELSFLVVDAQDLTAQLGQSGPVHLYPKGLLAAEPFVREEDDDKIIFENASLRATLISAYQDRKTGFALNLLLENRTDLTLNVTVDNAALNGRLCDPYYFVTLAPRKQLFTTVYWSPSFLTEGGLDRYFLAQGDTDEPEEDIEEVGFHLRAYDASGWTRQDLVDEDMSLLLTEEEEEEEEKAEEAEVSAAPSPVPSP